MRDNKNKNGRLSIPVATEERINTGHPLREVYKILNAESGALSGDIQEISNWQSNPHFSNLLKHHLEKKSLIIWGASGHAKVLNEFVGGQGYRLIALFDNNRDVISPIAGVNVYVGMEGFKAWRASWDVSSPVAALVAIGGTNGRVRLDIQRALQSEGIGVATVIHPTAFVATGVKIGAGSHILAQSAIASDAQLGEACIVNTRASIDHETVLGDAVHVAPGATITGCARIGSYSFIGPGAVVTSRRLIGENVIIGAGAVVVDDIPNNVVAFGVPARPVRENPVREKLS